MQFEVVVDKPDLNRTIEEVTAQLLRDFKKEAPGQFTEILDNPPPSKEGGPPAKRTGNLIRTLKVNVINPTDAEIIFPFYVQHLEPFFEEPNHDRPFVQRAIARTLDQL